jgi:hypothetical protein
MITEADTCRKYILPKLTVVGWDAAPQSFSLSSLITSLPKSANAVCSLTMIDLSQVTGLPLTQGALKIYERLQHKDLAKVRELMERLKDRMKAEG